MSDSIQAISLLSGRWARLRLPFEPVAVSGFKGLALVTRKGALVACDAEHCDSAAELERNLVVFQVCLAHAGLAAPDQRPSRLGDATTCPA